MEHQTEKKHTTVGGIAGIVYQYYVFLYNLLTMQRGEVVSFEKLDDTAKETPNFIALYQAKHSVKYGIDGEESFSDKRYEMLASMEIDYASLIEHKKPEEVLELIKEKKKLFPQSKSVEISANAYLKKQGLK